MIRRLISLRIECTYWYHFAITSDINYILMNVLPSRILGCYMGGRGRKYLEILNLSRYVHNTVIDAALYVLVGVLVAEGSVRLVTRGLLVHVIVDYLRILIFFVLFPFNGGVLLV